MPCKKCKDGKYKWGNTGECKYATKEECEKANPKKYKKMKQEPSPLGNKTYEEYAKELKEYRLSKNPKLEKVELGLVDDLKTILKLAEKYNKESKENIKQAESINKQSLQILQKQEALDKKLIKIEDNAKKTYNEFKRAVKDLGINDKDSPAFKINEEILSNLLLSSREDDVKSILTMRLK